MSSTIEKTFGTGGDYATVSVALAACDWSLGYHYKLTALSDSSSIMVFTADLQGRSLTIDYAGFKNFNTAAASLYATGGVVSVMNGVLAGNLKLYIVASTIVPTLEPIISASRMTVNSLYLVNSVNMVGSFYVDNSLITTSMLTSSNYYAKAYIEDVFVDNDMSIGASRTTYTASYVYNRVYCKGKVYANKYIDVDLTESGCGIWATETYTGTAYKTTPSGNIVPYDNDTFYSVSSTNELYRIPRKYGVLSPSNPLVKQTNICPGNTNKGINNITEVDKHVGCYASPVMVDPPSGLLVTHTTGNPNVKVSWDSPQTGHDSDYSNVGVYWLKNDSDESFQRSKPNVTVSGLTTTSINVPTITFEGWEQYYFRARYLNPNA